MRQTKGTPLPPVAYSLRLQHLHAPLGGRDVLVEANTSTTTTSCNSSSSSSSHLPLIGISINGKQIERKRCKRFGDMATRGRAQVDNDNRFAPLLLLTRSFLSLFCEARSRSSSNMHRHTYINAPRERKRHAYSVAYDAGHLHLN